MIDFWPKAIFSQRFPPKISSLQATSKNTVSQNCYLLSVICNAKNRFWKLLYCYIVTLGVNWHCPRNRNSPRETYFSFPKTVMLQAVRIESHDVNDLSLWHPAFCHYTAEMNSERHIPSINNEGCKWHFCAACSLQLFMMLFNYYHYYQ